jgi:hypothetical protein
MDVVTKKGKTPEVPRTSEEKREAGVEKKETPLQRKMRGRDMVSEGIDLIVLGYKTYYGRDLLVDVSKWEKGMPDRVVIKPNFFSFIINRSKNAIGIALQKIGMKK